MAPRPVAAPGPIPVSGSTRLAGVIGHPIRHSLSPALCNAAFAATALDWVYLAFDVREGHAAEALSAMRTLALAGLSVTMPHKEAVAAAVDRCTAEARLLGAVNCVVPDGDGGLVGHNTDGPGFLAGLRRETATEVAGRRAVVLGGGGAARAVVLALAGAGAAEVVVVNRSRPRAEQAAALAATVGRVGAPRDVAHADLVVNATSLGMADTAGEGALPPGAEHVGGGQVVADLVYRPLRTPLLALAGERGAATATGLGMLVGQAAVAFTLWTGVEAPVEAMWSAVADLLRPPAG